MKKILSLILAGLMSLSCAAFVAADDAAAEATADPYQEYAISFLEEYGIYKGGEGLTDADLIQRYQMALFVARIATGWVDDYKWDYNYDWEDNYANNSTFTDLAGTPADKYYGAISYANQMGIIEGYNATQFGPTDGITYRDALTMVVRTLGYTGLAYPWGNIQKAVELGLTEGIEATYTDILSRGEVAVIIYNALFAETKSGETLAKSMFDVDFGWENIVIVSTDEGGFLNDGVRPAKSGFVGFKVINEDLTLSAKTYYVPAADLGLTGHEEELALGNVYVALFEIDGDLVELVDYDTQLVAHVVNNGITDNEGVAYATMPIAAALQPYTQLMGSYNGYLTNMGEGLVVYRSGLYEFIGENGNRVAIDNATGNILVLKDKTTGAPITDADNTFLDHNNNGAEDISWATQYEVAWYYNKTLDRYYQYAYDTQKDAVLVNWMSDAEFEAWYKEAVKYVKGYETQYVPAAAAIDGKEPYAKLDLFNADADALAEIALYKEYSIGIFSNTTEKCDKKDSTADHSAGVNMPTYTIAPLDDEYSAIEKFVEAGHACHEDEIGYQFAWINMADDVIGFKNEDGTYNNGVVLWDYNTTTGELEIVKYIPENAEGTDADSYFYTGILQGYSTKNATITVDGEKKAYGYKDLNGTTLSEDNGMANRRMVAEELDAYLMQYVKVLVVDGRVVDVDLLTDGKTISNYLVVLSYAGMTSDGYIAVYAYDITTAELGVYKVNSFNGWKKGDYRYYPENAVIDAAFVPGTVYEVKSYDLATNSYGVETMLLSEMAEAAKYGEIEIVAGYRTMVLDDVAQDVLAVAASQSYVLINEFGVPTVINGKAADGSKLTGDMLVLSNDKIIVFVDGQDTISGTFATAPYGVGFVMYTDGRVLEAAYDDAQDIVDYYLLGSTKSTVAVYNMITGSTDYATVDSTNIDLVEGAVYMTVGNTIVRMYESGYEAFIAYMTAHSSYTVVDTENTMDTTDLASDMALATWLEAANIDVLPGTGNDAIEAKYADAKIGTVMVRDAQNGFAYAMVEGTEYDVDVIINGTTILIYTNLPEVEAIEY